MVDWGSLQYLMYVAQYRRRAAHVAATVAYKACRRRGLDVCREDDAAYLPQLGSTSAILLCVAKVNQELGPYQRSPRRSRPIRCVSVCVREKI